MTPLEALELAIKRAGGQTALARLIGKKQGNVSWWLTQSQRCSPEATLDIERKTGVSRQLLRPDLYPPSNKEDNEAA